MQWVLLNGQGDYVEDYDSKTTVPPGCFIREVTPEQHEALKKRTVRILANGTIVEVTDVMR